MKQIAAAVILTMIASFPANGFAEERRDFFTSEEVARIVTLEESIPWQEPMTAMDEKASIEPVGKLVYEGRTVFVYHYMRPYGQVGMTQRTLFITHRGNYLGQYYGLQPPEKIENNLLYYDFPKEFGNTINAQNGVPERVWLNGDIILLGG
ncbi:hypothetical protein [Aestuariispira insulae]|uniref:Uncharacterized protein n=1 Tax=Aestuariispira insulae TaxID=1461337 RepID=A0A3D9HWF3_9PROT|nr:hypothetical protein [Aestuariispira insulae]RED53739.1 hypothetical protein DFP90_101533 [Aestuariispira insulae]